MATNMGNEHLPIYGQRDNIIASVIRNQLTVISGDTGCGKTTQVPQYLFQAGLCTQKSVVVTQPRRISAISVSQRVAQELGDTTGTTVGFEVRFLSTRSESTRISFVTEAILLKEAIAAPTLSRYGVIVIDEAHERSIHSDLLLGLMLTLLKRRPDMRLVVMSATLETEKIISFFSAFAKGLTYSVVKVSGRFHPIEIYNLAEPLQDYLVGALNTVLQIHASGEAGDVIVFLTGQEEIEELATELRKKMDVFPQVFAKNMLKIVPLFAALPPESQQLAFQREPGTRKVILSTNIAETAVTIEGIRFVVDCGFVKQKFYDERKAVETLAILPISKASASQRAGRAGRTEKGKCYRLYTAESLEGLAAFNEPVG